MSFFGREMDKKSKKVEKKDRKKNVIDLFGITKIEKREKPKSQKRTLRQMGGGFHMMSMNKFKKDVHFQQEKGSDFMFNPKQ